MKITVFSLIITVILIFSIGCSTENPICGDTLCVDGSVFLKSDLTDNDKYDSVSVDESGLIAALGDIPPAETRPANDITLSQIINETLSGVNRTAGKAIKITGTVDRTANTFPHNDVITLETSTDTVVFYITNTTESAVKEMAKYEQGVSYTFTLFVLTIRPPDANRTEHEIWTAELKSMEAEPVELNNIVSNVAIGGDHYLAKLLKFEATVQFKLKESDAISLITKNAKVAFFVTNWNTPPDRMGGYIEGQSYPFTVFLRQIDLKETNRYIQSNLVVD